MKEEWVEMKTQQARCQLGILSQETWYCGWKVKNNAKDRWEEECVCGEREREREREREKLIPWCCLCCNPISFKSCVHGEQLSNSAVWDLCSYLNSFMLQH
jgi:hypothetical protein